MSAVPPIYGHDAVFGPMPSLGDVWQALVDTTRTWLPTYLRERERLSGRPYASLPSIRGWRVFAEDLDAYPGDQLPLAVVVAPGLAEVSQPRSGIVQAFVDLSLVVVVSSVTTWDTIALAADYGAAARLMLMQHASLGGVVQHLAVTGETYDGTDSADQRTIGQVRLTALARIDAFADATAGPTEPFPDPTPPDDPGGPVLGYVETTDLQVVKEAT